MHEPRQSREEKRKGKTRLGGLCVVEKEDGEGSGSHSWKGRRSGHFSQSGLRRSSFRGRIACSERINLIGRGWGWRCQAYFWACTDCRIEHGGYTEDMRGREVEESPCDLGNVKNGRIGKNERVVEGENEGRARDQARDRVICRDGASAMDPSGSLKSRVFRRNKRFGSTRSTQSKTETLDRNEKI